MPRKRNRKMAKSEHVKENKNKQLKSKFFDLKQFNWSVKKSKLLLNSIAKLKPAGLHKHISMLFIRENFSEKINEPVSTSAIWEYINCYWNIDLADELENKDITIHNEDFDLPKDEEWLQLIDEQNSFLNINDTNKDVINQSAISNVDPYRLKTVKVMVEKLDIHSLLANCFKSNQLFNWDNTLKNGLDDFQISSQKRDIRKTYKLRNQSVTTRDVSTEPDNTSRSFTSKIKSSTCVSNFKSKKAVLPDIKKKKISNDISIMSKFADLNQTTVSLKPLAVRSNKSKKKKSIKH